MTRSEIENKLSELHDSAVEYIKAQPVKAFAFGILIGAAIGIFRAVIVPFLVLGALGIWAGWFIADKDAKE